MSTTSTSMPIDPLKVGDRVQFAEPADEAHAWWVVRAGDDRFTVLTRQRPFHSKGTLFYTIIDRQRGVRGPCSLVGQGWDIEEPDGPEALLRALQRHDEVAELVRKNGSHVWEDGDIAVEVSHRNNVPVIILAIAAAEVARA